MRFANYRLERQPGYALLAFGGRPTLGVIEVNSANNAVVNFGMMLICRSEKDASCVMRLNPVMLMCKLAPLRST